VTAPRHDPDRFRTTESLFHRGPVSPSTGKSRTGCPTERNPVSPDEVAGLSAPTIGQWSQVLRNSNLLSISMLCVLVIGFLLAPAPGLSQGWSTEEGTVIQNGLDPGDTFPDQSGELSAQFENAGGGEKFARPVTVAETEVTHLSEVDLLKAGSVAYVAPGDTGTMAVRLRNTGNGPDTYALSGFMESENWDTDVRLDLDGDSEFDPGEVSVSRVRGVASRSDTYLLLRVGVPSSVSTAQRDTFVMNARSLRTEDPEPGSDTVFLAFQTDTSSVDVFNPNPPFDYVDTQAITNDTSVQLDFRSLASVDSQSIEYEDPTGATQTTGFHPFVNGDSDWTLTDEEGEHTFRVRYRFENGGLSDTYVDTIRLDHSKPTNPVLFINQDAETAASLSVTLDTFSATDSNWDAGDTRGRVVIDNDSSFSTPDVDTRVVPADGDLSGTSWEMTTEGEVFAKFIDAGGNVSDTVSDTIALNINTLNLDRDQYTGLEAKATVTVNDFGANEDPGAIDDTFVRVVSTLDDEGIRVRVTETTNNSGLFKGTFRFTEGFSDEEQGRIFVEPNAAVTVEYVNSGGSLTSDTATWLRQAGVDRSVEDVRTWPNPFRPNQGQPFVFQNLPADRGMEIMIFNVSGQLVRQLTVGRGIEFNPNGNTARWFGRNDVGDMLASGTYIYVVESKYGTKRGKLTLVK
jgi:hypothetical protein